MINVKPYLTFIIKNKLTQSQFLLLYIFYYGRTNKTEAFELIELYKKAFPTDDGTLIGKPMLNDLIRRKYLTVEDPSKSNFSNYQLTDKFLDIFVDKYTAGNEIWDLYPTFLVSGGKTMPLTAMDKNEFRETYWKGIGGLREEHEEILLDVKFGVEKKLITMKIENFVKSEYWVRLRKERLGDFSSAQGNIAIFNNDIEYE